MSPGGHLLNIWPQQQLTNKPVATFGTAPHVLPFWFHLLSLMLWSENVNFPLSCLSTWHLAQASLVRPCQLWGRISFVQLWRLGKSSTTFRCTLLQSSKDKEDFLCLLSPPQTFTSVAVNRSRISFVQECQCQQLDLFIFQLSLSLKLSLSSVWFRAPAEYPLYV